MGSSASHGDHAGADQQYHFFSQHIDARTYEAMPEWLRNLHQHLKISAGPDIKVRVSWVDRIWFTSIEGSSLVHVRGSTTTTPAEYALLWLGISGQHRPSGSLSVLPRPGEMVLLNWPKRAGVISAGEFRYLIMHIPIATLVSGANEGYEIPFGQRVPAFAGPGAVLGNVLRTMASEAESRSGSHALAALMPEIAALVRRTFSPSATIIPDALGENGRLARIRVHLEANLIDPDLDATHVARACGVSLRQFYRSFDRDVTSFSGMLRQMRIERASHLLILRPMLSIAEIAYASGFRSLENFCRVFGKMRGCTPSAFRRAQLSALGDVDAPEGAVAST